MKNFIVCFVLLTFGVNMASAEVPTEKNLDRVWDAINYGWVDKFKEQIDAGVAVDTLTPEGMPLVAALVYADSQSHL